MKKLFAALLGFVILLVGCDSQFKHQHKVSMEDVINDRDIHMIYTTHKKIEGDYPDEVSNVLITKNGKVKNYKFKLSEHIQPSMFSNKTPAETEDLIEEENLAVNNPDWVKPQFIAIDGGKKTPKLVFINFSEAHPVKADDAKSLDRFIKYADPSDTLIYNKTITGLSSDYNTGTAILDSPGYLKKTNNQWMSNVRLGNRQTLEKQVTNKFKVDKKGIIFKWSDVDDILKDYK